MNGHNNKYIVIKEYAQTLRSRIMRTKLPVRTKITVPYFFLSVLLAISAAFLVSNIVFDTVDERFQNQLGEVGQLSSELVVIEEEKLLETLRFFTNSKTVIETFSGGNPEELRKEAFGIALNQQVDAVEFLNENGDLVLSMRHIAGGNIEDYSFTTGGNDEQFQSWDFVKNTLENQDDLLGDKFAGFVQASWGNYLYVSGSAFDPATNFHGVVLVGTRLENLTDSIHSKALGHVTIYDMNGQVIASSLLFKPESLDEEFVDKVITLQDQERSQLRQIEEKREIMVNELAYTEVLAPWKVRGDTDIGILGAALQKNFIVRQSPLTRFQVTAIIAVALLLVILIGLNLANIITRPLKRLVEASQIVSTGDLSVQVDLESNDEISTLATSFNQMVTNLNKSRNEILEAYDKSLEGWTRALELRDKETEGHTQRVTKLTVIMAEKMGFEGEDLANVRRGALLHDIGKMGIPDNILHKPDSLNEQEWVVMKKHPEYAYEMLKDIKYLKPALDIPRYHHEHWDGKGYPYGLRRKEIPLTARIFSVVDAFDALTNDRVYRKKTSTQDALRILQAASGKLFDPTIVSIFQVYIESLDENGTIEDELVSENQLELQE